MYVQAGAMSFHLVPVDILIRIMQHFPRYLIFFRGGLRRPAVRIRFRRLRGRRPGTGSRKQCNAHHGHPRDCAETAAAPQVNTILAL